MSDKPDGESRPSATAPTQTAPAPAIHLTLKESIASGARFPLATYMQAVKMESEGFVVRVTGSPNRRRIELLLTAEEFQRVRDLGVDEFYVAGYDVGLDRYILARDTT